MSPSTTSLFLVHAETGQRYPIRGEVSIGRTKGEIVFAQDKLLSGMHCRLQLTPGGLTVEDLESSAGTQVNGRPIQPRLPRILLPGDVVTVGGQSLRFESISLAKRTSRRRPSHKRSRVSMARPHGPEQLAGHLLILLNLGVAAAIWAYGPPLLGHDYWSRLFLAPFEPERLWLPLLEAWTLFALADGVARVAGGFGLLVVYFFAALTSGIAAHALFPASVISSGAFAAVAGVAGAWLALQREGLLSGKNLRAGSRLAIFVTVVANLFFAETTPTIFALVFGAAAGYAAIHLLILATPRREWMPRLQVALALAFVIASLGNVLPHARRIHGEADVELASPRAMVESDMTHVMDLYEQLGRKVQKDKLPEAKMAEVIREQLIPGLTRVQGKLEVLKPLSENERRLLELDRDLTRALLTQVTAMAQFEAGKDPKQNELIEKSTAEIEKLSVEWKREHGRIPAGQ